MIRLRLVIAVFFLAAAALALAPAMGWLPEASVAPAFVGLVLFGGFPLAAWLLWALARRK